MAMFDDLIPAAPPPAQGGMFADLIPQAAPVAQTGDVTPAGRLVVKNDQGAAPAPPISGAPADYQMPPGKPPQTPMSFLPSSVGGAVRDFGIGSQAVGTGLRDIALGPFDLAAGVQNAGAALVNKLTGTNIPAAKPASQIAGDIPVGTDTANLSDGMKLLFNAERYGTQGLGLGSLLSRFGGAVRAPGGGAPQTTTARVNDAFTRPYLEAPATTVAGDTAGGVGSGVAQTAVDEFVPDNAQTGGTATKHVANAVAPVVGGVAGTTVLGGAAGLARTLTNLAKRPFTAAPPEVPLNPKTNAPYSPGEIDRAAAAAQGMTETPRGDARAIRRNADELQNPTKPGETPVDASALPTTGRLADSTGLAAAEEAARLRNKVLFVERDEATRHAATERVASVRDPEADLGAVMRRAGTARTEALAPAEQTFQRFQDINQRLDQERQGHAAPFTPIANTEAKANASRALDRNVVEQNYVPARAEKNRQFDEAPGRHDELPADEVFAAIDRVRQGANGLAPGTLPNDFMQRIDRLRPRIDPETGENLGGPGTASGADLADLRKFVSAAQQRAQQGGNFDLADNIGALGRAINRTITEAPGYAEANANYSNFAQRFRPERNDPGAQFTRELDRGGQQPDGTLNRGGTPPSETANRFLSSPETAAALNRIMAGAPNEAAGHAAVRDYLRSDFASAALNPDGTLNPRKVANWTAHNADVLAQFPNVRREFDDIAATARRGDQLSTQAREGLDQARNTRDTTASNLDKGTVGELIRKDPRTVAEKILNGGFEAEGKLAEVKRVVDADPEAARGFKAAMAEALYKRVTGNRQINESYEVQLARLDKEFKGNREKLAQVFSPEEMNALQQGHKLMSYFANGEKRALSGSQTAEREALIPGWFQLATRHVYGDLKGGGIIKRMKLLIDQLPSSKQGAQEILDQTWFNPELAAYLLDKKLPDRTLGQGSAPTRRLIGAANVSRDEPNDRR